LVDESRVYHIEGEAPEGVELGDIAHYFNAETSNRMIVVSWTGDEVEYYRGVTISAGAVAASFNLRAQALASDSGSPLAADGGDSTSGSTMKVVGVILLAAILFAAYVSFRPTVRRIGIVKTGAPAAPLVVGHAGSLDGKNYRITGHALVEISQVHQSYDRHEYNLLDDAQNDALLICGLKPGTSDWVLFIPANTSTPLTPQEAAAKRIGETVNIDGLTAPISDLFQSVVRQAESPGPTDLKVGNVQFGLGAKSDGTLLLGRWNAYGIGFFRGKIIPKQQVIAAFRGSSEN
jgi:hypothetical protein